MYVFNIIKDMKAYKVDKKVQKYKTDDSIVFRVFNNSVFEKYRFPQKYNYALEDWDFYVYEWTNLKTNLFYANNGKRKIPITKE